MKWIVDRYFGRQLWIMTLMLAGIAITLSACEKEFDIDVKANKPQLIVEAYISNLLPEYNYVVLSRSQDYFEPNFQAMPVKGAKVTITEGEWISGNSYSWDTVNRVTLQEVSLPGMPSNFQSGVYIDPLLIANPSQALTGKVGKHYLLEITEGGRYYYSITEILPTVKIDSLTADYPFYDEEDKRWEKRLTVHYKDPDTIGNVQFYYWRFSENRNNFGWGGIARSRSQGPDDLTNGQVMHITHTMGMPVGDTVDYYLASLTRDVYNFWDSYIKARSNGGPYSTPVVLKSTMHGKDVIGCFTGQSIDHRRIIIP